MMTDFDWDGSLFQESAKRYAKRSKQRPFKLPEALATNDRGKDWDAPPDPDPEPWDTRLEEEAVIESNLLGIFGWSAWYCCCCCCRCFWDVDGFEVDGARYELDDDDDDVANDPDDTL